MIGIRALFSLVFICSYMFGVEFIDLAIKNNMPNVALGCIDENNAKDSYYSITILFRKGYYSRVINKANRYLTKFVNSPFKNNVILLKAKAYNKLGQSNMARRIIRQAIKMGDDTWKTRFTIEIANSYISEGKLDRAVYELTKDKSKTAARVLATLYIKREEYEKLVKLKIKDVILDYYKMMFYFNQKKYTRAISVAKNILKRDIPLKMRDNIAKMVFDIYYKQGNYKMAIRIGRSLLIYRGIYNEGFLDKLLYICYKLADKYSDEIVNYIANSNIALSRYGREILAAILYNKRNIKIKNTHLNTIKAILEDNTSKGNIKKYLKNISNAGNNEILIAIYRLFKNGFYGPSYTLSQKLSDKYRNLKGILAYYNKRYKEAIRNINGNRLYEKLLIAKSYIHIGKYKKAIKILKKIKGNKTITVDATFNLGVAYYNAREFALALKSFKVLQTTKISNVASFNMAKIYIKREEYKKAYNILKGITPKQTSLKWDVYYWAAYCLYNMGQYKKAISYIEKIGGDYYIMDIYRVKMSIYRAMGDLKRAIYYQEKIAIINKEEGEYETLINLYLEAKEENKAITAIKKISPPKRARYYDKVAMALIDKGKLIKAARIIKMAISSAKNKYKYKYKLASIYKDKKALYLSILILKDIIDNAEGNIRDDAIITLANIYIEKIQPNLAIKVVKLINKKNKTYIRMAKHIKMAAIKTKSKIKNDIQRLKRKIKKTTNIDILLSYKLAIARLYMALNDTKGELILKQLTQFKDSPYYKKAILLLAYYYLDNDSTEEARLYAMKLINTDYKEEAARIILYSFIMDNDIKNAKRYWNIMKKAKRFKNETDVLLLEFAWE